MAEGSRLLVDLQSRDASEVWALLLDDGLLQAGLQAGLQAEERELRHEWVSGRAEGGGWHCLGIRSEGLSYSADYMRRRQTFGAGGDGSGEPDEHKQHGGDSTDEQQQHSQYADGQHADGQDAGGQYVLIVTDGAEAAEGALRTLREADAIAGAGRDGWMAEATAPDGGDERTLERLQCFDGFVVIEGRHGSESAVFVSTMEDSAYEQSSARSGGSGSLMVLGCQAVAAQLGRGGGGGGDRESSGGGGGGSEGGGGGGRSRGGGDEGVDWAYATASVRPGLLSEGQGSLRLCGAEVQHYMGPARLEISTPLMPPHVVQVAPVRCGSSETADGSDTQRAVGGTGGEVGACEGGGAALEVSKVWSQPLPVGYDPTHYVYLRLRIKPAARPLPEPGAHAP